MKQSMHTDLHAAHNTIHIVEHDFATTVTIDQMEARLKCYPSKLLFLKFYSNILLYRIVK